MFVLQARKTRSKFFLPQSLLTPTQGELLIQGVGDVEIKDQLQRITTGRFGIYAYEVDKATGNRQPVYVYLDDISTKAKGGLEALEVIRVLLSDAMIQRKVPYGLKGTYFALVTRTQQHLEKLPDRPNGTCFVHEAKWDIRGNVLHVPAGITRLRLTEEER